MVAFAVLTDPDPGHVGRVHGNPVRLERGTDTLEVQHEPVGRGKDHRAGGDRTVGAQEDLDAVP